MEREHEHDEGVTSLSLSSDRPLDPATFVPWIEQITQKLGVDIMRMKGIIAFKDDPQRFVVQAVHMMLEGGHQRPWRNHESRTTRLVFIGRNLPRDVLKEGLDRAVAAAERDSVPARPNENAPAQA